jgi:DNA-binding LacI/PurR family transcriptional regulator
VHEELPLTTIKDIAKRVGVSHSTVSRALQRNPLISDGTSERIRQAAAEMGYQPSAAARSLKTRHSQVLGVILSSLDDPFFSEILQGIEDTARDAGYSLFIAASHRDPTRSQKIVRALMEHRAEGIIICSTSFSAGEGQKLLDGGFPVVVINNQSAENFRYAIFHDDLDGCRQLTRHLIELGHKKIAFLGDSLSGRTSEERLLGYQLEMQAAGISVPEDYVHLVSGGGPEHGISAVNHFMERSDRPTAIVCFNDMQAIGLMKGLQQAGLDVPGDISITGFDNILFSTYTNPPLTTFDQPKRFIGIEATQLLLMLLRPLEEQPANLAGMKVLKGRLLVRKSTARPPVLSNARSSRV